MSIFTLFFSGRIIGRWILVNILIVASLLLVGCSKEIKVYDPVNPTPIISESVIKLPLQIVEFFDFGCGHCLKMESTMADLKEQFGNQIEIIYANFPLSAKTFVAHEASECARQQNQYASYKDLVFANFGNYEASDLQNYAKELELDMDKFNQCLVNHETKAKIVADQRAGEKAGVTGTPALLINDEVLIAGAYPLPVLSNYIENFLLNAATQTKESQKDNNPAN